MAEGPDKKNKSQKEEEEQKFADDLPDVEGFSEEEDVVDPEDIEEFDIESLEDQDAETVEFDTESAREGEPYTETFDEEEDFASYGDDAEPLEHEDHEVFEDEGYAAENEEKYAEEGYEEYGQEEDLTGDEETWDDEDEYAEDDEDYGDEQFNPGPASGDRRPFYIRYFNQLAIGGGALLGIIVLFFQLAAPPEGQGGDQSMQMEAMQQNLPAQQQSFDSDLFAGSAQDQPPVPQPNMNNPQALQGEQEQPRPPADLAQGRQQGGFMSDPDRLANRQQNTPSRRNSENMVSNVQVQEFSRQTNEISEKADTNAAQIENLKNQTTEIQNQISSLQEQFNEETSKIKEALSQITPIKQQLNNLSRQNIQGSDDTQSPEVQSSLESLEQKLSGLETRIDREIANLRQTFENREPTGSDSPAQSAMRNENNDRSGKDTSGSQSGNENKSQWYLRGAQPGRAWVAKPDSGSSMRMVRTGDSLDGVGTIQEISIQNGRWVIVGSSGRITQ